MFTGSLVVDVLLGDVHSLKEKRAVVRPLVAELRRRFSVAAAEVGDPDLHRRANIAVATVAGEAGQVIEVLDACERLVAGRPEIVLLGSRRQLTSDSDWEQSAGEQSDWGQSGEGQSGDGEQSGRGQSGDGERSRRVDG